MEESNLPWGRTDITVGEVHELISVDEALKILRDQELDSPEDNLNSFVRFIPEFLSWLENRGRDFPWRKTQDPWVIYTTEILLQNTRAESVNQVYSEFHRSFPDSLSICDAQDDDIMTVVEPLGMGSRRTRTLKEVAEHCVDNHGGQVPESREELQKPWRVGTYVADAVQLFARDQPAGLVDRNTKRVIAQTLQLPSIQETRLEEIQKLLSALNPERGDVSRAYNLALLDLGAMVFRPRTESHDISMCPLDDKCPVH